MQRLFVLVVLAVLAAVLAGCPGKPPVDPTHTPAGPKPCERMADHVLGLMQPVDPATGEPIEREPEAADKITRLLIARCTDDRWTIDAQQCFQRLTTFADIEAQCSPLLTVEQREALVRAIDTAFPPPATAQPPPPAAAPPPPPAPTPPAPDDPCQGGEVSNDPCQGGE